MYSELQDSSGIGDEFKLTEEQRIGIRKQLKELAGLLELIEQRLGTPLEQQEDFNQARALGHEIRNRLTVVYCLSDRHQREILEGVGEKWRSLRQIAAA